MTTESHNVDTTEGFIPNIFSLEIKDSEDNASVEIRATLHDPAAIERPPTMALVVGLYLVTNHERIMREAWGWFELTQGGAINAVVEAADAAADATTSRVLS